MDCKLCGKGGFFFFVDRNGLCKQCAPIVQSDIVQHGRIIKESVDLINHSKNFKTRLRRCDDTIRHLRALIQYEEKGISTTDPPPSQAIKDITRIKSEIITNHLREEANKALAKADVATTAKQKINAVNKALLKIAEAKESFENTERIVGIEFELKQKVHRLHYDDLVQKAEKAEFKGQIKKAIDAYMEALYFLKTDEYDDEKQSDLIRGLEEKITKLRAN